MAETEKTGEIKDPNSLERCNRCGGEHKQYQVCNIDERIIELNKEKQALQERCERLERKHGHFTLVILLMAQMMEAAVAGYELVENENAEQLARRRASYELKKLKADLATEDTEKTEKTESEVG